MNDNVSFELRDRAMDRADGEIVRILRDKYDMSIATISDLVNTREPYPQAYPTLLELLERPLYPIRIREMLVRSLTCKDAHALAFTKLLDLFRNINAESSQMKADIGYRSYRSALANSLAVMANKNDRSTLKCLASDSRYGNARAAFFDAMRRWSDRDVDNIVMGALQEPFVNVRYAAIDAAGIRRIREAIPALREAEKDENPNIRAVARKALRRIAAGR